MLAARLAGARRETDALFDILKPEALYDRPVAERHRIIFYLGHLEAFDNNLLRGAQTEFDKLFAFGIDPVGGGLPTDQPSDWPSVEEIQKYNRGLRAAIDQMPVDEQLWNVAIEHRLMHAETLAYMLHQMPLNSKVPQAHVEVAGEKGKAGMVTVPEGSTILGRSEGFGWDNEFDSHTVHVPAFMIDRYKVTNGDYLQFVREGGYQDRWLWSDEAWQWKEANGIVRPVFWKDDTTYRTMFAEIPMPLDWPVYVSHSEANAYAQWIGKALPAEAEWHRAAEGSKPGNAGFKRWDPVPVTTHPGLIGNGWEWTSTLFEPFPGFKPFPFYPGYSANFFDGKHYVMKGGSARTADCLLRTSFRNWFQPNYQYVYSGFRCVQR